MSADGRPRHPQRRRADEATGALVLIGGNCSPTGEALGRFIDAARGRDGGCIVGFTTASGDPVGSARAWRRDFARAGATHVEFPIVDRRTFAQDERLAALIRGADGIFLGGGDQVHLMATIGGSAMARAIRDAHAAGTPVCGTSAGAAALTETILANGEPDETGQRQDMYMGPGLGLLGFHTMIDTHFAERRRLHRLFLAVARNPELLGLGIDEDTALVVRGCLGEVVGVGGVTFVDGRTIHYDTANEARSTDAKLTLSYMRVGLVGAGHVLDLRERELAIVVEERKAPNAVPMLDAAGNARADGDDGADLGPAP
jgi:cyanophycinase